MCVDFGEITKIEHAKISRQNTLHPHFDSTFDFELSITLEVMCTSL
jgi:hypothetical protein